MTQICNQCSRLNPSEASYCYFDGTMLAGHAADGVGGAIETQPFPRAFVFPSGLACNNFEELALACQEHWADARELVEQGYLETFLGSLGRADLALAARQAARFPDKDRGFDQFLARLPCKALKPPKLSVEPQQVPLGRMSVGENRCFELRLKNEGMRLLYGTMSSDDCPWLAFGDGPGAGTKLFEFGRDATITVHVRGQGLRAGNKPLEGRIVIESNGGTATVVVNAEVPPKPFAEGVLAGAHTPRQLAEKARDAPKEAAGLLEGGAVARWYKDNGWPFPIQGPPAAGLGAVQQFFEALGLAQPPKVDINERTLTLEGDPGQQLSHHLEVKAQEKRPVYAHGVSDQPWLEVGRAKLDGRIATIPLVIPSVPDRPGETVQANVTVTSNGQQRFVVPVTLRISGTRRPGEMPGVVSETAGSQAAPLAPFVSGQEMAPTPPYRRLGRIKVLGVRLFPVVLLALVLIGLVLRDVFLGVETAVPKKVVEDRGPRISVEFHDSKKGDFLDDLVPPPSMRFGLVMVQAKDSRGQPKRLNPDSWGRTNNTCVRIDGDDRLFGTAPGRWQDLEVKGFKDEQGRDHPEGVMSQWLWEDKKLLAAQFVERVPGEQTDLLDTCLVRYVVENQDTKPHQVGLRFLLDTYIGANDGVPFTIPGAAGLCDDRAGFQRPRESPGVHPGPGKRGPGQSGNRGSRQAQAGRARAAGPRHPGGLAR